MTIKPPNQIGGANAGERLRRRSEAMAGQVRRRSEAMAGQVRRRSEAMAGQVGFVGSSRVFLVVGTG